MEADYSKTAKDVYIDFFQTYADVTQDLDLFCQSSWGIPDASAQEKGLPSWCPDFSSTNAPWINPVLLFAQCSILCAGNKHRKIVISDLSRLILQGIGLGQIQILEKDHEDSNTRMNHHAIFGNMPETLEAEGAVNGPNIYQPSGEEAFQAYWRTLLAECKIYPTQRLDADDLTSYKKIFDSWQQDKDANHYKALQKIDMLKKMNCGWRFALADSGLY